MLRCKTGDLAIVLKSGKGREGFIVTVGRFIGDRAGLFNLWAVDARIPPPPSYGEWCAQDKDLLPIRPDELNETEETEKEIVTTE